MLQIIIPARELWDESSQEFVTIEKQILRLEHSLVSISKWESKWCKPFLSKQEKSDEETLDYVRCMTLTQNVDPKVYEYLTEENVKDINRYIDAPMTATTINRAKTGGKTGETVTAELIYYWMIALNIPFECQKWHLNKLLTLVEVCNVKNAPPKKRSKKSVLQQQAALNAARRKKANSKG